MSIQNFDWKEKREDKVKNYIIFSYILSLLLIGLMFINFFFMFLRDIPLLPYNIIFLLSFLFCVYFASKYLKDKIVIKKNFRKENFLFFFIFTMIITFLIHINTIYNKHLLKVYYFVPIILATVNYGRLLGFFVSGCATFNLLVLDYLLKDLSNFDFDIIIIILFFWIAWLIGGFMDLERGVQEQLKKMAVTDSLTGLPNHANFQNTLEKWFERAKTEEVPLSLAIMDLDNFKLFNDSLGHRKGDQLLKDLAGLIEEQLSEDIFFARYGGDEFVFVFYNYTKDAASKKLSEIKDRVEVEIDIPYNQFLEEKPTFSLGIGSFPEQAETETELIDVADHALYQAKSTQKNKIQIYYEALHELKSELKESEKKLLNSVRTLLSIINAKDRYTYGHSERVAQYARKFAEELNLPPGEKKELIYGAFLHDVGKIEVDRKILMKPERLELSEWEIVKAHPESGAQIVSSLESRGDILSMVRYHHEDFEGTGYPDGLKGEEIPFFARILRIIDSFDAMTTERPYSSALSQEEAIAELRKEAGSQFDPQLVERFIKVIKEEIELN